MMKNIEPRNEYVLYDVNRPLTLTVTLARWSKKLAYGEAIVCSKVVYSLRMHRMEGRFQIQVGPT